MSQREIYGRWMQEARKYGILLKSFVIGILPAYCIASNGEKETM
jgi:hypothetical protein